MTDTRQPKVIVDTKPPEVREFLNDTTAKEYAEAMAHVHGKEVSKDRDGDYFVS